MNPQLTSIIAQQHVADLRRDAARERLALELRRARPASRRRVSIASVATLRARLTLHSTHAGA
jgi:hypothetical protein